MFSPSDEEVAEGLKLVERESEIDEERERDEMRAERERLHKVAAHVTGKQLLTVALFFIVTALFVGWWLWNAIQE